jgi:hypothetical protein
MRLCERILTGAFGSVISAPAMGGCIDQQEREDRKSKGQVR